jgi:23S rRNA pseudouridine955/2504/2580 synthase
VQAKPITGRTHQIRVHAKHAGHFILGDEKYGDPVINKRFKTVGLKRLFLHAASLSLNLPDHDSILKIEAPLDNDLQRLLKALPTSGDS